MFSLLFTTVFFKNLYSINSVVSKTLIPPVGPCALLRNWAGPALLSMVLGVEEEEGRRDEEDVECIFSIESAALEKD